GNSPQFMAAADLNGDGKPDLVVGSYNSGVGILLNRINAPGAFSAASFSTVAFTATGGNPYAVAVGDLNGDGKLDVVASNYNGNTVAVLTGKGDGTLNPATTFSVGANNPRGVALADFNGDGKLDVATANDDYTNDLSVFFGTGTGSLGSAQVY